MIKLGVNTVLFKAFSFREAAQAIKLAGYDGLEISAIQGMCEHLNLDDWKAQKADLLDVMAEVGLTFLSTEVASLDKERLKKAFEANCKKRSTENLKEEAPKIMAAVSDDAQLHTLWKSYQKKYPYAADISYEDIMKSTMLLWSKIQ